MCKHTNGISVKNSQKQTKLKECKSDNENTLRADKFMLRASKHVIDRIVSIVSQFRIYGFHRHLIYAPLWWARRSTGCAQSAFEMHVWCRLSVRGFITSISWHLKEDLALYKVWCNKRHTTIGRDFSYDPAEQLQYRSFRQCKCARTRADPNLYTTLIGSLILRLEITYRISDRWEIRDVRSVSGDRTFCLRGSAREAVGASVSCASVSKIIRMRMKWRSLSAVETKTLVSSVKKSILLLFASYCEDLFLESIIVTSRLIVDNPILRKW